MRLYRTLTHLDGCVSFRTWDNDDCTCEPAAHRKPGRVGSFTVHSPDDYAPRHRAVGRYVTS